MSPSGVDMVTSTESDFAEVANAVLRDERTLLGEDRLWVLWQAIRNVRFLGLPAAEVGSYRGGSAFFIASAFQHLARVPPPVEAIDTFEGHPRASLSPVDHPIHAPGHFGDTSFDDVRDYLAPFPNVTVRKGAFADIAPKLPHGAYCFCHLDVDLYDPTRAALEYFCPRLAVGGVIVLDDFGANTCPGIRKVAEEFLDDRRDFQSWHPHTEQLVLIRIRLER